MYQFAQYVVFVLRKQFDYQFGLCRGTFQDLREHLNKNQGLRLNWETSSTLFGFQQLEEVQKLMDFLLKKEESL